MRQNKCLLYQPPFFPLFWQKCSKDIQSIKHSRQRKPAFLWASNFFNNILNETFDKGIVLLSCHGQPLWNKGETNQQPPCFSHSTAPALILCHCPSSIVASIPALSSLHPPVVDQLFSGGTSRLFSFLLSLKSQNVRDHLICFWSTHIICLCDYAVVGEWVCTLWVCCHFETCGRTLWQPYLAPYIALWLISKEREDCISVSLFLAEKVLQEVFFVFVLNHGIFDGVFFWFLYLNNPKTQLVWYCWAWRSAVSTWKRFQFVLSTSMLPKQPGWSCWWENVGEGVPGIWGWQWIAGYFRGPQMDLGGPRIFCPTSQFTDESWYILPLSLINPGRAGLVCSLHLGQAAA